MRNEELHTYSSPNIIKPIKSKKMRCGKHVKDEECIHNFGGKTYGKKSKT